MYPHLEPPKLPKCHTLSFLRMCPAKREGDVEGQEGNLEWSNVCFGLVWFSFVCLFVRLFVR